MALVYPGVTCALCGEEIDLDSRFFATSGTFYPPEHRLFKFCDAPIHWDCYERWADQQGFARQYFLACLESNEHNPYWGIAFRSSRMFVELNPEPPVEEVRVHLAATGSSVRVPLGGWRDWLADEARAAAGCEPLERQALHEVWPSLMAELTDPATLIDRVDWEAKQKILEEQRKQALQAERARLTRTRLHNKACRAELRKGLVCPFCEDNPDIRYVDRSPQERSCFICRSCGRSFGPAEISVYRLYGRV